jgi:putative addiction module component (TIGR02574 family)
MPTVLERIEHDALRLPEAERAFLADRLLNSLSGGTSNDLDAAWLAEVERRYDGYKMGKRQPVPASQVFAEANNLLK